MTRADNEWPMFALDCRNSNYRPGAAAVSSPSAQQWAVETAHVTYTQPIIARGTVIFGDNRGTVWAVDGTSGTVQWQFHAPESVGSEPAIIDGVVYIGNQETPEIVINGTTYGGRTGNSPALHAVDLDTGAQLDSASLSGGVRTAITPYDSDLIVGSMGGTVRRLSTDGFACQWTHSMPEDIVITPAISNEGVHVCDMSGRLTTLDIGSGGVLWQRSLDSQSRSWKRTQTEVLPLAVDEDTLLVVNSENELVALETATGELLWVATEADFFGSPAIADRTAVVGTLEGRVIGVDIDSGNLMWTVEHGGRIGESAPTIGGDHVYFGIKEDNHGRIYCVELETGATVWDWKTEFPVSSAPTVAGGNLFVAIRNRIVSL